MVSGIHPRRCVAGALAALLVAIVASAAESPADWKPEWGQEGKDVIWVPTPDVLVERMLDMAQVAPGDVVVDLGSGDGRLVIAAAKRGARARGIEYEADLVALSRRAAAEAGVADRATFVQGDFFETDFSDATVVTMFLGVEVNLQLRPKLMALAPGSRIVSNTFELDRWKADETLAVVEGCNTWCEAYLWVVPVRIAGRWRTEDGEMSLSQEYQMVEGTLSRDGNMVGVIGRVSGDRIELVVGLDEYSGRVEGGTISGWRSSGARWSAVRAD